MPNDAKLGLVFGVGLVVLIAVVFFRRDGAAERASAEAPAVNPASLSPPATPAHPPQALKSRASVRNGQLHVVRAGETLYSLARYYYRNDARFVDIYEANRQALTTPDPLPPGTVLVIPDLPD